MSDHRFYVSVMTPAASSGSLTFQLDTYDADYNVSLTPTVTGITAGMSEIDLALTVQTQLTAQLLASGAQYNGAPRFSAEPYAATFRLTRTEHSVCFWSQAQFRLQLTTNTTGTSLVLSTVGCLATLAKAKEIQAAYHGNTTFSTGGQVNLSDAQVVDLIESLSGELTQYLRNNVIISTYLGEWRTDGMKSTFTSPNPGLSIDPPLIRRKNLYEMYSIPQYSMLAYNWIRHTGQLVFRFNQTYVNAGEPFELDNEVRVTFVAGESALPSALQRACVEMMNLTLRGSNGIEELAGGTFRVKFRTYTQELERIFRAIRHYAQRRMR